MTPTATQPAAPPTLLTAAEFTARYENLRAELVQGVVKEVPMAGSGVPIDLGRGQHKVGQEP